MKEIESVAGGVTVSVIRIDMPAASLIVVDPITDRLLLRSLSRMPLATDAELLRLRNVKPLPATLPVVPVVFSKSMAAPPAAVIEAGLLKLIVPPFLASMPVPLSVVSSKESNE